MAEPYTQRTVPVGNKADTEWSGLNPIIRPEPWVQDAACAEVDPEMFFPASGGSDQIAAAKAVCGRCRVRAECGEYAVRTVQVHGVWGGKARNDLRAERKRRKSNGRVHE